MDEKNTLYMLSLNRFRIFVISSIFLSLFGMFFFIGLAFGLHSVDISKEIPNNGVISSENLNATRTKEVVKLADPYQKKEFKNKISTLSDSENYSSADLLREDQRVSPTKLVSRKKVRRSRTLVQKSSVVSGEKYYLQILVTANKKKADSLKRTLLSKKYHAYMKVQKQGNTTRYLIRVGLYQDKMKAQRDLAVLRKKGGFVDAFMTVNPKTKRS